MKRARLDRLAYYLPASRLDNDTLASLYPSWSAAKILEKTGVRNRHIAADGETASDLAYGAARRLMAEGAIAPADIDFMIFCTQEPDYFLPSSSCILQQRLELPRTCGAIDVNQGCSGYVYSLGLAKGLIESEQARSVLVLTGDTYSKLINPRDKSVRTLFGDAGSASLVTSTDAQVGSIGPVLYGTDGRGADRLIVHTGGFRRPRDSATAEEIEDESGNARTLDNLFMDGPDVMAFCLREVPRLYSGLLRSSGLDESRIDYFVFHQGSRLMLESLRRKLKLPSQKFVIDLEETGNTVSSTIPIALSHLREARPSARSSVCMLVGFGVGYSWAGAIATI